MHRSNALLCKGKLQLTSRRHQTTPPFLLFHLLTYYKPQEGSDHVSLLIMHIPALVSPLLNIERLCSDEMCLVLLVYWWNLHECWNVRCLYSLQITIFMSGSYPNYGIVEYYSYVGDNAPHTLARSMYT